MYVRYLNSPLRRRALLLELLVRPAVTGLLAVCCFLSTVAFATAQDDADDEMGLDEQTIYIPYEKLREVFERDGRGVYLTYEKFQQLWQAAQANRAATPPAERPLGPVIQEIDSVATIGDAVVEVVATLRIEIPPSGWSEVPLRLADAAIRRATINEQPARIVFDGGVGYKLVYENPSDDPLFVDLQIEYLKAYEKLPGASNFVVAAPQATINRWTVQIPEEGVDVTVEPTIAATRGTDDNGDASDELIAFVGAADQVRLKWNPKAEGASGLEAFATVRSEQQLIIGDGVIRTVNQLVYDISRAAIGQLSIRIPADQKVINVFDRNVKKWEVSEEGEFQILNVELFEPSRNSQTIMIELEKFIEVGDGIEISAPLVEALNVGRQQGILVTRLEGGLQGEATRRVGLLQMDPSELTQSLQQSSWGFAFRYGAIPYELDLAVRKVAPRISVTERTQARINAQELAVSYLGEFDIQDAGVFQLAIEIPANYEVRTMEGAPIANGAIANVDTFHRDGDSETRWIVNLRQRAFGRTGLLVDLRQKLDDPNLRTPTGDTSQIAIGLPHVASEGIEHSEGTVVVTSPETLRVNPTETSGLRPVSFNEAPLPSALPGDPAGQARPVLAYAFSSSATSLELSVERRRPYVSVQQLLVSEIEAGVIRHSAKFFYNIRYSGVESLRIDLPSAIADEARNKTNTLRRQTMDPQPDDVEEGYVAWEISSESELLGAVSIHLEWEDKIDELGLGTSVDFDVPKLLPQGVDRATGQLVTVKAESIDLYPVGEPAGLRPLDPQNDLMPQADVSEAAMAFEFVADWSLSMRATRYELEESKRTSVERAVVRVVALAQGELSVQALYRVRSAKQRLPIKLPEDAEFDSQPLRINGQSVTPERDASGTIFAPLAGQSIDTPFVLELRYSVPGEPDSLSLPIFADDPAVQKVYLCSYLSPKLSLIGSQGPWTDEELELSPLVENELDFRSDAELIQWVVEGLPVVGASATSFPVGKNKLYVFSTLRPENPPDGSLQLRTVNRMALQGFVFLAIAVIGFPLYGRSIRLQVAAIGLVVVALMVLGVFLPRLSIAVVDNALWAAIATVAVVWAVGHVRGLLKRFNAMPRPRAAAANLATVAASQQAGDVAAPPVEQAQATMVADNSEASGSAPANTPESPSGGETAGGEDGDDSSKGASS